MIGRAVIGAIDELARDVGRLRRRAEPESSLAYLAERLAARLDALDAILQPCAAELVAAGYDVDAALAHVDARTFQLRSLLAEPRR